MLLLKLEGEESALPLAPPRNRSQQESDNDLENSQISNSALQPASNGLPPTPKVHMGACFSKVSFHHLNQSSNRSGCIEKIFLKTFPLVLIQTR